MRRGWRWRRSRSYDFKRPTANRSSRPIRQGAYDTAEYRLNSGLKQINAGAAYAKGIDGTGQTVAVIDTGINTTLAEFAGALHPASTDIITERKGQALTDADGHGTAVASIIARPQERRSDAWRRL